MLHWLANLPIRKRVGLLAALLGFIAIFLGDPYDKVHSTINLKEIGLKSVQNSDLIEVDDLADWLIEGKMDYRLIDLRTEEKYNEYHIPSAELIDPANLLKARIQRNEKILLYADDDLRAAQGWYLLKTRKYASVYILKDGLNCWKEKILFPKLIKDASEKEKAEFAKIAEVSKFFGGVPQMGVENSGQTETREMPKLKAPAKIVLKSGRKKPKREGC